MNPKTLIQSSSSKNTKKRSPRKSVRTDVHELFGGDCVIYRTPNSGRVYQFQMWVKEEQKYVRKSTRTKNLETGISVGKEFYLDVHSKLRYKEPIFSKKFKDVVEEFIQEQRKLVGLNKSLGRWVCIKVHTNHMLNFVGENTNLLEVQNNKWKDYYSYRKTLHPEVVNGSLLNEKYTIGSFYKFCVSKKYLPYSYVPEFPKIDSASRRREHYTEKEWRTIYTFLRTNDWLKHENQKTEELRKFIRDFVIILINTGLRPKELRIKN